MLYKVIIHVENKNGRGGGGTNIQLPTPIQNVGAHAPLHTHSPRFPRQCDVTVNGGPRMNIKCVAWNQGSSTLVGHAHPTIWTLIKSLRKDVSAVEGTLRLSDIGQPPKKRVHRVQMQTICYW